MYQWVRKVYIGLSRSKLHTFEKIYSYEENPSKIHMGRVTKGVIRVDSSLYNLLSLLDYCELKNFRSPTTTQVINRNLFSKLNIIKLN